MENIVSILDVGFVLIPNKRELINALLGEKVFTTREPQEFGMTSFTQLPLEFAAIHRSRYGNYGIIVDWDWALRNGAQRVVYLEQSGPLFGALAWLFRLAKQEIDQRSKSQLNPLVLENKHMAGSDRANLYAQLLTLYEYLQPERSSAEVEWRVVNKFPEYHFADELPRDEMIRQRVATAKLWKGNFGCAKLSRDGVIRFVCPRSEKASFVAALPNDYRSSPVVTYRDSPPRDRYARIHERALTSHRLRERQTVVEQPPPPDTMYLHKFDDRYRLPEVSHFSGARLLPNEVRSERLACVEYRTPTGQRCELSIPLDNAIQLTKLIKDMEDRCGLGFLDQ